MINVTTSPETQLAVVGLGYVGLPLAVAFARKYPLIGFDISQRKISDYMVGIDATNEVGRNELIASQIRFTSDETELRNATFIIVAVPTPITRSNSPDLSLIVNASQIVGRNLRRGAIVVYESTVYPGVTEEICLPILERESGMKAGSDFGLGYSPERINPGDSIHRLETITKIVAGINDDCREIIARTYEQVITAGVKRVSSIKVAEAAKVIENCQRDINIAFVNELSMIFDKMGIDTCEVIDAASTKWNFLKFYPGLVGGHCIGVDPYYLTYKAQELGYHPEVILAGRRINDNMGKHVAAIIVKLLIKSNCPVNNAKVLILGLTFKENVSDIRNTKAIQIMQELKEYGVNVTVHDPWANGDDVFSEYGFRLVDYKETHDIDAIVVAVAHDEFRNISLEELRSKLAPERRVLVDVKGIFDRLEAEKAGLIYWRL